MDASPGPMLALAAAASFGSADFGGGMLSRRRPAVAVVGASQAISLAALAAVVAFIGPPVTWNWLPWSMLAGACGSIGLVCFYRSLAFGTVGVVSPVSATGAAIPAVIGLAGGETLSGPRLAGIVVAIVGAVLASGPELRGEEPVRARAVWFAAAAAACFGVTMWAIARGSAASPLLTLVGMRTTSVLGFAVLALATRSIGGLTARDLPALAAVGVADVGANGLLGWSSTFGLLSVSAALAALYPVVTVALAAVVLRERMRPVQVGGVAAAVLGVVLVTAG